MEKKVRAHLIIKGRVQGVFFRVETQRAMAPLGVHGWVRNLPDQTVEALLEGSEENVRKGIEWCRLGPPAAHVTDVVISWEPYVGDFDSFRVVR